MESDTTPTQDLAEPGRLTFSEIVVAHEKEMLNPEADRFEATIGTVDRLREHCEHHGLLSSGNSQFAVDHWYTRLASAITDWALHPEETLNADKLEKLIRRKNEFVYIFAASGYRNMTHLISQLSRSTTKGKLTIDGKKIVVLLGLLGLDDLSDELISLGLNTQPQVRRHLMLGWLNQRAVSTRRGEENRSILLSAGDFIEEAQISDPDIGLVVNAYMYTSYASLPTKHAMKASFNRLLEKRMLQAGIGPTTLKTLNRKRPRIVLLLERFRHQHAMFRSFGPYIRGMRDTFELIGIVEDENIDIEAESLFDEVHKLARRGQKSVKSISGLIEKLAPDVVFYPSLGMSHWTVMLSNLRLARIQIIGQGHPATSQSSHIDYVVVPKMHGDPTSLYSERVLMCESPVVFDIHSSLPETLPPRVVPSDREVRVAVNSKVMKLSYRLLEICERLSVEASVPVRFFFFPGEFGWYHDGISALIKQKLGSAEVFPYQAYDDFLKNVASCDMALAAFPFGNTNSTVDTCLLGIPTVAHYGPEVCAQTDETVMAAAGCPSWLICDSDEKYFTTALELINDAEKREDVAKGLLARSVRERLTVDFTDNGVTEIRDLIEHVYKYHDQITTDGVRLIKWSETVGK
jgi:hypothetical protein